MSIAVGIGQIAVLKEAGELAAYALGSCVALCLYDRKSRVGTLAHIFLPHIDAERACESNEPAGKYANTAVPEAIELMRQAGASEERLEAAIVGGAAMFPFGGGKRMNIGEMNVSAVTWELEARQIRIAFSDTGGTRGRTVFFTVPGESLERQIRYR